MPESHAQPPPDAPSPANGTSPPALSDPRRVIDSTHVSLLRELLSTQRLIVSLITSVGVPRGASRSVHAIQREAILGFAMISDRLALMLSDRGVEAFGAVVGSPVDLGCCEVLGTVESDAHPPGTVAELLRPGALCVGKVVERALVTVHVCPPQRRSGQPHTCEEGGCK